MGVTTLFIPPDQHCTDLVVRPPVEKQLHLGLGGGARGNFMSPPSSLLTSSRCSGSPLSLHFCWYSCNLSGDSANTSEINKKQSFIVILTMFVQNQRAVMSYYSHCSHVFTSKREIQHRNNIWYNFQVVFWTTSMLPSAVLHEFCLIIWKGGSFFLSLNEVKTKWHISRIFTAYCNRTTEQFIHISAHFIIPNISNKVKVQRNLWCYSGEEFLHVFL